LTLRRARLDDMPALARLYRRTVRTSLPFVPELHTPEDETRWFAERLFAANEVWLAEESAAAAGYIAFRPGFIEHLFVEPESQGRGLGAALLEKALEANDEVSLWTFQQNAGARRFYRREGFVEVKLTDGADNEERLPDVLCRWRRAGQE